MATLAASLLNSTQKIGDKVYIGISIDTVGALIVGADVFLDISSRLKFLDITSMHLMDGDTFCIPAGNIIKFSQLTKVDGANWAGKGLLAVVTCEALSAGYANINIVFTLGSTVDSNVASPAGQDLLTAVTNKRLTIKA